MKPTPLFSTFLLVFNGCHSAPEPETGESDCPSCLADFAIYDPDAEPDGVWEDEVTALQVMLTDYGWTGQRVDARDINTGSLTANGRPRYRALIAPGGMAWYRDRDLGPLGEQSIRAFIQEGGGYLGFCAGTAWASETVLWAEEATGGGGTYNLPSDYISYPYDLSIYTGEAQGPFGWAPWEDGTRVSLEPASFDTTIPILAKIGFPAESRLFYYGGPVFRPREVPSDHEIWARAMAPAGLPDDALTGDGEPSVIRYSLGLGTVVLFSYHPVILPGSDVDGVTLQGVVDESQSTWDLGNQTLEEVNLQSWNILHAAMQLVAGEEPTPIDELPN